MKKIITQILLILLSSDLYSQSGWNQQTLPVSGMIYDIEFLNANTGFISMNTPAVLKTSNGGNSWIVIKNIRIFDIDIIDSTTLYGNGRRDSDGSEIFYRTFNLGVSWDSTVYSLDFGFRSINFFNKDTGLISGAFDIDNLIWRTTNGGNSIEPLSTITGFGQLFFLKEKVNNEYYGWNLSSGFMSQTTNSGFNWSAPTRMINGQNGDFISLDFMNKDTGWSIFRPLLDNTKIYKTTNSGIYWTIQYYDTNGNYTPTTIMGSSDTRIWAGNDFWKIVHATSNGGSIWGTQISQIFRPVFIDILDSLNGSVGYNWFSHTTDGGGIITFIGIDTINATIPESFILKQNYPNPFNPQTTIEFSIKKSSNVSLILFDILGKEILKIYNNENLNTGNYKAVLDFSKDNLSSGTYFYKLMVSDNNSRQIFLETKMLTYIK